MNDCVVSIVEIRTNFNDKHFIQNILRTYVCINSHSYRYIAQFFVRAGSTVRWLKVGGSLGQRNPVGARSQSADHKISKVGQNLA